MIVSSKTMKPQNVAACAAPGTDHLSSFRWPMTSVASIATSRPGCVRTASIRSGAGWPVASSRRSQSRRRPATANATTVSTRPMVIRRTTRTSSIFETLGVKPSCAAMSQAGGTGGRNFPRVSACDGNG